MLHHADCKLSGTTFNGAKLVKCNLAGAQMQGCDLTGADVAGSCFDLADLSRATLSSLRNCDSATFRGTVLDGAEITNCNVVRPCSKVFSLNP